MYTNDIDKETVLMCLQIPKTKHLIQVLVVFKQFLASGGVVKTTQCTVHIWHWQRRCFWYACKWLIKFITYKYSTWFRYWYSKGWSISSYLKIKVAILHDVCRSNARSHSQIHCFDMLVNCLPTNKAFVQVLVFRGLIKKFLAWDISCYATQLIKTLFWYACKRLISIIRKLDSGISF